ncbi:MAG: autotransporter domain-containing protein [Sphingomonas sp.]|nr:autotransporter domain-containing protein [Sphingomonas sp.]
MSKYRRVSRALACASLVALATPAAAQEISRIVVFGDSYADTGNALRLAGVNPQTTGIYTTGRFSGGSNYVDTLTNILQVPQFNFAIGGARTDNNNQTVGLPGFTFEVQQFLAGGGALGFPTVNTTLTRSDLVAVSIGGNDARNYQQTGGTLAGAPAAAATAVTSFQQNFNLVMQKGQPTISFLAGDTGQLPEIAGNPSGAAIRTAYSTAFNNGIQQVLAGYASSGSIVHYLDLTKVLGSINANPAAYGITALTCPALPNTTCVTDNNAPYLFYVDNLHLTSKGFAIVGQYVAVQLAAPLTLQAPSDLGFDTARQWGRTLASRSDIYGEDGGEGFRVYALGDYFSHDVPGTAENTPFEVRGYGATIGAEYGMAGGLIGAAGNYSKPRVNFGNEAARIRAHSWQIGAYGSLSMNGLFGQAYLGYGKDHNDITRAGVVQGMDASPHGNHTVAGAKGGYLMDVGGLKVGPIVAVDYARAKVDGYTEAGDPALTLNVSSQSLKSFDGQAGIEVRGEFAGLKPFLDVTAERDFTGDDRAITFAQTSAPGIVNTWDVPGPKQTYARVSGGAAATLAPGISIDAFVSTTFSRKTGNETGAQLGLKAKF